MKQIHKLLEFLAMNYLLRRSWTVTTPLIYFGSASGHTFVTSRTREILEKETK